MSSSRIAALFFVGISLVLFSMVVNVLLQEYRIAVNPHSTGNIDRTWIIVRDPHNHHVRVADLTFTVTEAGKSIKCQAKSLDIGDGTFDARAGDSIELSPVPGSCARPHVINIQPPTWVMGMVSAVIAAVGFGFALMAWRALSNPMARRGSWVHR